MDPAPPPLPAPIQRDLLCVHCGYNLRTLSPHSRCPDCGTEVALTLHVDRSQPSLAQGIHRIAAGAWVFAGLMTFEVLANLYFQLMRLVIPHFWRSPADYAVLPVARTISVTAGILGTCLMASSGLAPRILRKGSPHLALMLLAFAICWGTELLAGLLELSIGLAINGPSPFTAIWLIRALLFIIPVGLVSGIVADIYACIFLRGICERPELRSLRPCWLPLLCLSLIFTLIVLVYCLFELYGWINMRGHIPGPVQTMDDIYDWAHYVRDVAQIICLVILARIAGRLARQHRPHVVPTPPSAVAETTDVHSR